MFEQPEFWVAVAFVIFLALVWKKAGAALAGILDARAAKIKEQLDEAVRLREEAQGLLAGYQRRQREAQREAEEIVASAKREADRLRGEAQAALEAALKRREEAALVKIAQAEAKAVQEVRDMAVDLAIGATSRLLVDQMDPARAGALVDQAIAELPAKLN